VIDSPPLRFALQKERALSRYSVYM
jgi:hypothetical protein